MSYHNHALHILTYETAFVDMLNEMRFGRLNSETIKAFQKLSRPVKYTDDIEPTELYVTLRFCSYADE